MFIEIKYLTTNFIEKTINLHIFKTLNCKRKMVWYSKGLSTVKQKMAWYNAPAEPLQFQFESQ